MQPKDLNPEQRSAYKVWRWMGLSESAALNALCEDGLLQTTDHDQFTEMFRKVLACPRALRGLLRMVGPGGLRGRCRRLGGRFRSRSRGMP
jgi:hypothetical protein